MNFLRKIEPYLPWIIISLGIVLRVGQYLANRSFWVDEASIVLNVSQRTFFELFKPLSYEQHAPIGFLIIEWVAIHIFGNKDYIFRVFPLIFGILSLFLFQKITRRFLTPRGALFALVLFVLSDELIYYSSEAKQYMGDVFVALLLYYYLTNPSFARNKVKSAVLGAIAIWFSHPAVFILVGIGLATFPRLMVPSLVWLASFGVNYLTLLHTSDLTNHVINIWSFSFLPTPKSLAEIKVLAEFILQLFAYFSSSRFVAAIGIAFVIGMFSIWVKQKANLIMLILPFVLVLSASFAQKYPFVPRLLLFFTPALFILIAEGLDRLLIVSRKLGLLWIETAAFIVILWLFFYYPLYSSMASLAQPRQVEEIKPLLSYYKEERLKDDILYVYYGSEYAFRYYAPQYGINPGDYTLGIESRGDLSGYIRDLRKLEGHQRIWILFSHTIQGGAERKLMIAYLDRVGKKLLNREAHGADIYLYDLR